MKIRPRYKDHWLPSTRLNKIIYNDIMAINQEKIEPKSHTILDLLEKGIQAYYKELTA